MKRVISASVVSNFLGYRDQSHGHCGPALVEEANGRKIKLKIGRGDRQRLRGRRAWRSCGEALGEITGSKAIGLGEVLGKSWSLGRRKRSPEVVDGIAQ